MEVGFGLVLVYVVLSVICTGLSQVTAQVLATRASLLKEYLVSMLDEKLAYEIYKHPIIDFMMVAPRPVSPSVSKIPVLRKIVAFHQRARYPPRIPPALFSLALLGLNVGEVDPDSADAHDVRRTIASIPVTRVREMLLVLYGEAEGDPARLRASVARVYGYGLPLVEDGFQRRVRLYLWAWAFSIAAVANVDTIAIAEALWNQASQPSDGAPLDFPIGWTFETGAASAVPESVIGWVSKLLGILLTSAAVIFGAEFWLGLFERVSKARPSTPR